MSFGRTQEIALSALTGGRGVLCVYVLGLMTLQLTLGPSMVDTGVEADWAKSDPTGPLRPARPRTAVVRSVRWRRDDGPPSFPREI